VKPPKQTGDGDIYALNGKIRSVCSVCGTRKVVHQKRKPKYLAPFYFPVYEKVNWFRGDDEYLGIICKDCLKAGRINEVNKVPR
jgi:hypothetical protein